MVSRFRLELAAWILLINIDKGTTTAELHSFGFDPLGSPNLKILTYLDIVQRFMFNPQIKKEDLDEGAQVCIDATLRCQAYGINEKSIARARRGNVML
jgi:hypothetical protein